MMNKILYTGLFVLVCAARVAAQDNVRSYVRENIRPVRTIQPDSSDYSDLEPLGAAIGDARVVMLGEQDHGDAPSFLAKTRIIKYLHEKKGFGVLAFESDFFGLNYGWDSAVKVRGGLDSLLKNNIFPVWTFCDACQPLMRYIPSQARGANPLVVTGFDCQMWSATVARGLDSLMRALRLPIVAAAGYEEDVLPALHNWGKLIKDSAQNGKYLGYLEEIRRQLVEKGLAGGFWVQVVESLQAADRERVMEGQPVSGGGAGSYLRPWYARDTQMAANLRWLTEQKFAGKKVIVWAANFHISKYSGHYTDPRLINEARTMGTVYTGDERMMKQIYVLGFTSLQGEAGRITLSQYKVPRPGGNAFERWMDGGMAYGFVDFGAYNRGLQGQGESFYMAGGMMVQHRETKGEWNRVFDGVFYIRDMYPCRTVALGVVWDK